MTLTKIQGIGPQIFITDNNNQHYYKQSYLFSYGTCSYLRCVVKGEGKGEAITIVDDMGWRCIKQRSSPLKLEM